MSESGLGSLHPVSRRAVAKYGVFRAFADAGFATPFYVVFMVSNTVTYTDIAVGTSVMAVTTILLELPSGYFADVFGRRRTMFLSQVGLGLGTVGYVVSDGTVDIVLTYLAFGIGAALRSGAGTAWFYDKLAEHDDQEQFAAVMGQIGSYVKYVTTATMIGGGLLYLIEPVYAVAIGAATSLIAAPVVLSLPTNEATDDDGDAVDPRAALTATRTFLTNPTIRAVLLLSVLSGGAIYTASKYIQPTTFDAIPEAGYSLSGVVVPSAMLVAGTYAVFTLGSGVMLDFAERVQSRLGLGRTVAAAYGGGAACMILPVLAPVTTVPAVVAMMSLPKLAQPGVRQYLNDRMTSDTRATINSAESFLGALLRIPVMLASGAAADVVSPRVAMAGVGASFLAVATVVVFADRPVIVGASASE
ncbi:MFS transporter [Halobaculum sp. MBLA0143]|uniref:MFS transporter n=1 Tax=Halobaculum sp. MBLA0143 TaxID=3079933 RepID=UPI0035251518